MATHGQIGEFNSQREDWMSYSERLEEYFLANYIKSAEKKKAILLSVVGAHTYQLMRSLIAPEKPKEKTFEQLVKLVQEHHQPTPSAIVQRYKFNSRIQSTGESVATFVAELRRLAEHCQFGQTLDDMLRDRLVCGITDGRVQRRLLAEPELTLKKALELAQAQETAEKGAQQLQQQRPQASQLHAIRQTKRSSHRQMNARQEQQQREQRPCYRCGGKHQQRDCPFRDAECHRCKKKGHLARVCQSKGKAQSQQMSRPVSKSHNSTHLMEEAETLDEQPTYTLFNVTTNVSKPLQVSLRINDADLTMEVDTGASVSLISSVTFQKLWPAHSSPVLMATQTKLRTYTGEQIHVLGTISANVQFKTQQETLPLLVVDGDGPSLLG